MNKFTVTVLEEQYAKEICEWKYEGDYSVYNFSDWETVVKNKWDLSIKDKREAEFLAILFKNELIAYGRITSDSKKAVIGVGLKPSWCGKGYGKEVMKVLIEECKKKYPNQKITLEIRSFNKRAIQCYKKVGFQERGKCTKNTINGFGEFVYMEYIE